LARLSFLLYFLKIEQLIVKVMINLTNSGANLSAKELIQSVFSSPLIGATCSQSAEELCLKNNLTFSQLMQPFSKISTEGDFF
jgi:hypothetical protein